MDEPRQARARHALGAVRRAPPASTPTAPGDAVWDADADLIDLGGGPGPSAPPAPQRRIARTADPRLDGGATKGHTHVRTATALDRLEDWLGLKSTAPPTARAPRPTAPHAAPGSMARTATAPPATSTTVDVLVHPVTPEDTLEGIALRYGADLRVVRRSNRLWPGDAAQMREKLYIPVVSCKWKPAEAEIQMLTQQSDGSFHPPHDALASVARQQVDREALGYFGARPPSPREDHGESGVDDLLRLQQRRREAQTGAPAPSRAKTRAPAAPAPEPTPAPAPAPAPDAAWRPNVWKFGTSRERPKPSAPTAYAGRADARETLFDVGDDAAKDDDEDADAHESAAPSRAPARLLDELLRGPPTNPGAAANWVRPIHWGESLPARPGAPAEPRTPFASLLADMTSARLQIEDAVGAAMHELRQVSRSRSAPRSTRGNMSLPM